MFSVPLGIFSDCNRQWCLKQGLNKNLHTMCDSVTNNGDTCMYPQIKNSSLMSSCGDFHSDDSDYNMWCNQLGGAYNSESLWSGGGCVFTSITCKGTD